MEIIKYGKLKTIVQSSCQYQAEPTIIQVQFVAKETDCYGVIGEA